MMESSDEILLKPKLINYLALAILWAGVFWSAFNGSYKSPKVLLGMGLLLLVTVIFIKRYKIGFLVSLIIMFLGVIGLIEFFPLLIEVEVGARDISSIKFNPIMLLVTVIHLVANHEMTMRFLNGKQSTEGLAKISEDRVLVYVSSFSKSSDEELEEKLKNDSILPEAKAAAQRLLDERRAVQ